MECYIKTYLPNTEHGGFSAIMTGFLLGLIYFLFALFTCLFTIYICFTVVMRITRYNDVALLNQGNLAAALIITSAFIAMAIMARNALYPIAAVVQDFWLLGRNELLQYTYFLLRAFGYLLFTVFLSLISICVALVVFQRLTKQIEEEKEIKRNNVAVGLVLGGVLISFAILMETGISDFVNALIPVRDFLSR